MADAHGPGPCVRKDVRVHLPPRPPETTSLSGCEREVVLFVAEVRYLTGLVTRLWDAPGPGDRSSLHGRVAVHHAANLGRASCRERVEMPVVRAALTSK